MMWRSALLALIIAALTLVSFGHQRLSPGEQAQAEAYLLTGGDWSQICADTDGDLTHLKTCLACLISSSCALVATQQVGQKLQFAMAALPTRPERQWRTEAANGHHLARAPPA